MAAAPQEKASAEEYVIGPQDVLAIAIWNQPTLSGKFPVEGDGGFTYPLLGKVPASGLTVRALQSDLGSRLRNGYLKDPQVVITIDEYRSQQVFLIGEVREPGSIPMTGPMTLLEALAKAKSTTAEANEIVIIRPANATGGPVLPEQADQAETIRVDLRALQKGDLSKNVVLKDGDTIFVPQAERVVVSGQVRAPGAVTISTNTTVRQVLAMVGGTTERAAPGRIKVIRLVNGEQKEIKVKLEDFVKGGDTLVVPARYF